MADVKVEDLQKSEVLLRRAEGRVETRRKKLAEEETALAAERDRHADLVRRYGEQHCPGA